MTKKRLDPLDPLDKYRVKDNISEDISLMQKELERLSVASPSFIEEERRLREKEARKQAELEEWFKKIEKDIEKGRRKVEDRFIAIGRGDLENPENPVKLVNKKGGVRGAEEVDPEIALMRKESAGMLSRIRREDGLSLASKFSGSKVYRLRREVTQATQRA